MTILHQQLLLVTCQILPLALPLLEDFIYGYLVNKYKKHWLVQLEDVLDLGPLEQGCAGFHKGSGKGSAVSHPIPRLVRALLVKYLYNLSYRQTEEKIDRDLLVKWFVGYGLFQSPPDHTTLQRFEIWVLNNQSHLFFNETLAQIKRVDPLDWEQDLQLVDTFAMLARAAKGRLIPLIRDTCRKLLETLERANPERYALLIAQIDQQALFGQPGDKPTRALNAQERATRLQNVVTQALGLHQLVTFSLAQAPLPLQEQLAVENWLALLPKIIFDETEVTPLEAATDAQVAPVETEPELPATPNNLSPLSTPVDTAPPAQTDPVEVLSVTERPNGKKGAYRVVALNDTDATFRHHGADKGEAAKIAYNASILTGTHYVHYTQADTGARPDPEALPEMLLAQYDQFGFFPPKVCGDQIYGFGKVRAAVDQASGGQTQLVALLPNTLKGQQRYGPLNFSFDPVNLTLTCPNNVVSDKFTDKPYDGGRAYRFTDKMCQDCPLKEECRKPDAKPKSRRSVFVSYYRNYNLDALEYNKTDQFKIEIKRRPLIERIIFNLTNLHGARRAKSTGQPKADFQLRMQATAFNIRQLLRRWSKLKSSLAAA
jgi:transposase